MTTHERTLSLIRGVYAAAADESQWSVALESLADEYGGGVAGFNYRVGEGDIRSVRFARVDPDITQDMLSYYATRNPWTRLTQPLFRTGRIIALDALLPSSELRRTEYYDGVLRRVGVQHCFGACLFRDGDTVVTFTAVRPAAGGPYQPAELRRVRAMLPHLQRAVQINTRLSRLQRTHVSLAEGLEQLHHGVVVVDRRGHVRFANRKARAIVAERDGLTISVDGLTASAREDRLTLRSLLSDAVRTSAGEGLGSGGAMIAARPSLKRPFHLVVAPLSLAPETTSPGLATVLISDPEAPAGTIPEAAKRLYGFSPTEARVVQALVATGSVDRSADELCISRETARWHLKRIYRKTGTDSQSSLVRLMSGGPLRLAAAESSASARHRERSS